MQTGFLLICRQPFEGCFEVLEQFELKCWKLRETFLNFNIILTNKYRRERS